MLLPNEPVTLSAEQIHELNQKLADLRHDVNNGLSLMTAAVELIQRRPENAGNMWNTLIEQPRKITGVHFTVFPRFRGGASHHAALSVSTRTAFPFSPDKTPDIIARHGTD